MAVPHKGLKVECVHEREEEKRVLKEETEKMIWRS